MIKKIKNKSFYETRVFFVRSRALNVFYFFVVLGILVAPYFIANYVDSIHNYFESLTDKKVSILITVDGLITTSTFAFMAFISISPSASGSSQSMNRLAWKGIWVYRYQTLLITTVLLTISDGFFDCSEFHCLIFINATLSGIILMIVITKYAHNNKNLNIKSARKLGYILAMPYGKKDLNKSFRNLVHPLRGTTNADFLKEVLQQPVFLDAMNSEIMNLEKVSDLVETAEVNIKLLGNNSVVHQLVFRKMMNVIRTNEKIDPQTKLRISVWVFMKIIKHNMKHEHLDVDAKEYQYTESKFRYFMSIFVGTKVLFTQSGHVSKKNEAAKVNSNLYTDTLRYFVLKTDVDLDVDNMFDEYEEKKKRRKAWKWIKSKCSKN